jgi:hypothetical protein
MAINKLIDNGVLRPFKGKRIDDKSDLSLPLVVCNPRKGDIEVSASQSVSLVVWHDDAKECTLTIRLAPHARLSITEVYASAKYASVVIEQAEGS